MSRGVASDAGIGRSIFSTRLQLSMQAASMCFWSAAVPCFFLPYIFWLTLASARDVDIVRLSIVASFSDPAHRSNWQMRDETGEWLNIEAVTKTGSTVALLKPAELRKALANEWDPVNLFVGVVALSWMLPFAGYLLMWYGLGRLGSTNQRNKRIRGARSYVSGRELDSLVRANQSGGYKLVTVTLPLKAPMSGILMQGAQGSGKSLAIHDLMQQAFAKKRKAIIYDQSGEFFRAYYRPDKDFFFNPACLGSVPWSIFSELQYAYDADTLAQAFLPPKAGVVQGASAFFEDAARALFSVMLLRLAEHGAQNTSDIAKAIFEMPEDEMNSLIEKSVASSAVGGDSKGQRQGVISSIAIYLNGIAAVAPGAWSIRDFLDRDDDSRFFILGTEDTRAMFSPLYRLLLSVSFALIASKQQIIHDDRYWFFLDEVHTLGDIKLDDQLATMRKFGVCIVSGVQSESQFFTSMGKDRGETVMNCFNTVLMLRMNEPSMMERAAMRLGKMEMEMVSQNQALAVTEWRDGAGMARSEQEKWLVMPSEIGGLADCSGFLKFVGAYPAAKVDYTSWLPSRPGAPCYADKFAPIQDSPGRDPKFILQRLHEAGSVNPLASVSAASKSARSGIGGTKETEGGDLKPQPTGEAAGVSPGGGLSLISDTQPTTQQRNVPAASKAPGFDFNDLLRGTD